MRTFSRLFLITSLPLLACSAIAHQNTSSNPAASSASMQFKHIMASDSKMPMKSTGDVDADFAAMMIMHHQQAIKMADVEMAQGKNADLKAMAQMMKTQQQQEIAKLKGFTKQP